MEAYSADCGEQKQSWQTCLCQTKVSESVTRSISSDISRGCGSSASDDEASALAVFDKYCHPDKRDASTTSESEGSMDVYITELPEISYLAGCASSGLAAAVMKEVRPQNESLEV